MNRHLRPPEPTTAPPPPPDRRVRAAERAGPREHGQGVPGLAALAGPAGGPEADLRGGRPEGRGPLPPRDPRPGPGRSPQPGQDLHLRDRRGALLLHDGAGRGGDPGRRLRHAARPQHHRCRGGPGHLEGVAEHGLRGDPQSGEGPERRRDRRPVAAAGRRAAIRRPRPRPRPIMATCGRSSS